MAALILPLISNNDGAVYDSTVGVINRLLQSDVAKAGGPNAPACRVFNDVWESVRMNVCVTATD
jgi:hypothetical protein